MSDQTIPPPTAGELEQVERANASGKQPVVFVHGLWLLDSSWDRWAAFFEEAGYAAVTPGWPDDPPSVEEAREDPDVFAGKGVGDIAAYQQQIVETPRPQAGDHRPLVRRPARADPGRARAVGGDRRDRPGAEPGRAAAADRGAEVQLGRPVQPDQPAQGGDPDLRPVPLRVRQRRDRGGGQGALRHLPRRRLRGAGLPGRRRQLQPALGAEGRQQGRRPRTDAGDLRRARPPGAARDLARRRTSARPRTTASPSSTRSRVAVTR